MAHFYLKFLIYTIIRTLSAEDVVRELNNEFSYKDELYIGDVLLSIYLAKSKVPYTLEESLMVRGMIDKLDKGVYSVKWVYELEAEYLNIKKVEGHKGVTLTTASSINKTIKYKQWLVNLAYLFLALSVYWFYNNSYKLKDLLNKISV